MDPFQYLFSLEKFGIKFGLDNIRALCAALGNPETAFPSALIAGTNGKGSVTAMVERAARSAGIRTGRYTSPHLIRLEERFCIDGRPVATEDLANAIERVRSIVDSLITAGPLEAPPTFFEVTTAVAFDLFRRARVDLAVLEVGMGGRLDSTNVVHPLACAITSIAFDHQQYLGHTLADIAAEKAGIIKPAVPVVIGSLPAEARSVVMQACTAAGAPLIEAMLETVIVRRDAAAGRVEIELETPVRRYPATTLGLRGAHQIPNAVVAVRLLELLEDRLPITPEAIVAGLADVKWPGRLQLIEIDRRRLLLDAAHNPAGASALADYLLTSFNAPVPIVFAAMRDKDVEQMIDILGPAASAFVATQPKIPRAREAGELAAIIRSRIASAVVDVEPVPHLALERARKRGPPICAAGSIFLIGDLLESLMLSFEGLPISRG